MERKYNLWSFLVCLLLLLFSIQSLYAAYNDTWSISPPATVLWLLSVFTFFISIFGFRDKRSWKTRWRSWVTVFLSFLLSAIFLLGMLVNTFGREHIGTTNSPDSKTTINFYTLNGGAATSISVVGKIDGPLWFTKRIYYQDNMDEVDVVWTNNHLVTINNHPLNLDKDEFYLD